MEDGKASDIVTVDLAGKTDIADYMVIASGTSNRHASALAERLLQSLKGSGASSLAVEGMREGEWVLLDAGDIIVHIFKPEVRERYSLEKMWAVSASESVTA